MELTWQARLLKVEQAIAELGDREVVRRCMRAFADRLADGIQLIQNGDLTLTPWCTLPILTKRIAR